MNTLSQCHRPLGKGWLDEEEYDGYLRKKIKSFGCKVIVDLRLIRQRRWGLCRVPIPLWHHPVVKGELCNCEAPGGQTDGRMEGILEAVKMQLQLLRSKADDFQDRLLHRQEVQPVKSLSWCFLPFLTLSPPHPQSNPQGERGSCCQSASVPVCLPTFLQSAGECCPGNELPAQQCHFWHLFKGMWSLFMNWKHN